MPTRVPLSVGDRAAQQPAAASRTEHQTQIQALRAIAVVSVVVFHFWPQWLTGGYVGVDVFFVISGYLMTNSILHIQAAQGPRLRSTMREFYSRRIARILPAAVLTLLVCTVITLAALPIETWSQNFTQILASAFFVENWVLAASATDYLGSTTGSVVQHFWSLSIEEQFYAVWPLIVWYAAKVGPRVTARGRFVRLLACFGALTALSFWFSVQETLSDSSVAYFHTGTRFWELSFGALILIVDRHLREHGSARAAAGWAGLVLIAYAVLTFDENTPFPSWRALVPVLGAALVIMSSPQSSPWGPGRLLAHRAAQWTGDISYSVYLLHWPMLILVGAMAVGSEASNLAKLVLLALVFVLAWLMKRHVEDRFRRSNRVPVAARVSGRGQRRPAGTSLPRTLLAIGIVQLLVIVVSLAGLRQFSSLSQSIEVSTAAFTTSPSAQEACFAAMSAGRKSSSCPQPTTSVLALVPSPLHARIDFPYERCQELRSTTVSQGLRCDLAAGSAGRVVIAGDSHMTMWIPAILPWAAAHDYSVTTFLRSGCPLTAGAPGLCGEWNTKILATITQLRPEYVLTSAMSAPMAMGDAEVQRRVEGLATRWQALSNLGSKIIAFRDIPQPDNAGVASVPVCLTSKLSFSACTFDKARSLSRDMVVPAARHVPGASTIDLSSRFCPAATCEPQIDGLLVWIDGGHMSSYFARSLTKALAVQLDAATARH